MNQQATAKTSSLAASVGVGIVAAVFVAIIIALQVMGSSFWQGIFISLGMFIILVASLNLASGFTGVFSLGHIGFMALGAYISAILTLPLDDKDSLLPNLPEWLATIHLDFTVGPFPLGFFVGTVAAGLIVLVVALIVGAVLMRLSGHFVAVATLGFLVIVRVVLINADDFTRGARTFSNVTPYTNLWWVYGWVALTLYTVWRIKFSAYGRAMFAQRDDVAAARSVGIVIMRPRLFAFAVSAFFSAVAGSLWGHFITSFSPNAFDLELTFRVITMLVVGGMGSVSGSVVGPVLISSLDEVLRRISDELQLAGLSGLSLAVLFLYIIIVRPNGLLGSGELNLERLGRHVLHALLVRRREEPERFASEE